MIKKVRNLLIDNEKSAVKAGFYYLVCQLLVRGLSFISTPIFTRLMTASEYGAFSNFIAWEGILFPFLTLNLRGTINKSKYDFNDENDSFLASILLFAQVIIGVLFAASFFLENEFASITDLKISYVRMLLIYIFFHTAFDFQQIQYNIYRKYKIYVFYSIISSVLSMCISVAFVLLLDDKTLGRIMGIVIPTVIICLAIEISIFRRAKNIDFKYIKYGLSMSIPLLPSALSATILSSSDKIVITHFCDTSQTAAYSVAYSIAGIAAILWTAMNQAWAPWLYDHLNLKDYRRIRTISAKVGVLYCSLIVGLMLIAPEILLVMGGQKYLAAIDAMPPVILAMAFQYFYAFYFDVEYFYGETYIISIGTVIAAAANLILNIIFIPKFGYVAAAYTTLVGYMIMFIYHFCIVKYKIKKSFIFNNKLIFILLLTICIIQFLIFLSYSKVYIRYPGIAVYIICIGIIGYKYRSNVKTFVVKLLKRK